MSEFTLISGLGDGENGWVTWVLLAVLAVAVIGLFVYNMFTKKKSQNDVETQISTLRSGDKIKTVGGIVGTIVEVVKVSDKEKNIIIETGAEDRRTTMTIDMSFIYAIIERCPESKAALELARSDSNGASHKTVDGNNKTEAITEGEDNTEAAADSNADEATG